MAEVAAPAHSPAVRVKAAHPAANLVGAAKAAARPAKGVHLAKVTRWVNPDRPAKAANREGTARRIETPPVIQAAPPVAAGRRVRAAHPRCSLITDGRNRPARSLGMPALFLFRNPANLEAYGPYLDSAVLRYFHKRSSD